MAPLIENDQLYFIYLFIYRACTSKKRVLACQFLLSRKLIRSRIRIKKDKRREPCVSTWIFYLLLFRKELVFFGSNQVVLSNKNINPLFLISCTPYVNRFSYKKNHQFFFKMIIECNLNLDHPPDNSLPEASASFEIRNNNESSSDVNESMVYHKKESDKW